MHDNNIHTQTQTHHPHTHSPWPNDYLDLVAEGHLPEGWVQTMQCMANLVH